MTVFDELLNHIGILIQQYGWYVIGIMVFGALVSNLPKFLPQSISDFLAKLSAAEMQRTRQLDKHLQQVRKRQIQTFESNGTLSVPPNFAFADESGFSGCEEFTQPPIEYNAEIHTKSD